MAFATLTPVVESPRTARLPRSPSHASSTSPNSPAKSDSYPFSPQCMDLPQEQIEAGDKLIVLPHQDPEKHAMVNMYSVNAGRRDKICGMRRHRFWLLVFLAVVVVVGAVGGGVGGSLVAKSGKKSDHTQSETVDSPTATPTSSSATPTSTSTTSYELQNRTYAAGKFDYTVKGAPITTLPGHVRFVFQNDNAFVVYNDTNEPNMEPLWGSQFALRQDCGSEPLCRLQFQDDGNLVDLFNATALWETRTGGVGKTLVFMNEKPWVVILDASGKAVWDTGSGVFPA